MDKSRLAAVVVCATLFLSACSSSDSPPMTNSDQRFNNGFFRSEYTFEVFDTGVTDTVVATLSEDGRQIVENGVSSNGNQYEILHLLDAAGRLDRKTTTESDGTVSLVQTFIYGANGLPTQTDLQYEAGNTRTETFIWTAADKIDLINRINRDADGTVTSQFSYQFSYVNGVLSSMRADEVPNTDGAYTELNYQINAQGQIVERTYTEEPSNDAGLRVTWLFDANGNQLERVNYNGLNEMVSRLTTTYVAESRQVYNRNLFISTYNP